MIVIPRGEVIRNFAYTGILEKLSINHDVHLISVVPNEEIKQFLISLSYDFYKLEDIPLSYRHNYLIGLLDLAHNRYLWSEAAKVRWRMRDVEANSVFKKMKRAMNKIFARLLANNPSLRFLERQILREAHSEQAVKFYLDLLHRLKPDLVFNGSHSHAQNAYPVIEAARLLGIKTCAFLFSWDNLTSQGRVIPPYDYYFAWNEQVKRDLLEIYPNYKAEQILVTGTPQFSFHFDASNFIERHDFLKQLGLQPDQKYALYSSGMSHHMPYEPEVAELVADILKEIDPQIKLVVRTYAKDKANVFDELRIRRPDIIIPTVLWEKNYQTPLKEDQIFFTNLLRHCELGVNVASTISLELCMFDKPAINIGFDPPGRDIFPYDYYRFYSFDHYKPIVDSGAVQVAKNETELRIILCQAIESPKLYSKERKELINNFFQGNIGRGVIDKFVIAINQIGNDQSDFYNL